MYVPDQPIQGQSKRPKQPVLKPLWQRIADRANAIPDEELAKIQHDSAVNLDHYLYGAPKVHR